MNYSPVYGYCDSCGPAPDPVIDAPEMWKWPRAVLDCAPCEISLCQKCHDEKHKLKCKEPPEMYSTRYYFYPEWLPQ